VNQSKLRGVDLDTRDLLVGGEELLLYALPLGLDSVYLSMHAPQLVGKVLECFACRSAESKSHRCCKEERRQSCQKRGRLHIMFLVIFFFVIEQIAEVRRVWFRVKTDAGRNARGHDVATCHRLSAPHLFVSLFQAGPVGKSRQK
jgi:hypothetical protein